MAQGKFWHFIGYFRGSTVARIALLEKYVTALFKVVGNSFRMASL